MEPRKGKVGKPGKNKSFPVDTFADVGINPGSCIIGCEPWA